MNPSPDDEAVDDVLIQISTKLRRSEVSTLKKLADERVNQKSQPLTHGIHVHDYAVDRADSHYFTFMRGLERRTQRNVAGRRVTSDLLRGGRTGHVRRNGKDTLNGHNTRIGEKWRNSSVSIVKKFN